METELEDSPNLLKDFASARKLMKTTSRGKNPDWYRAAVELNSQLHLFASISGYRAYLKTPDKTGWQEVKPLSSSAEFEALSTYVSELRDEHLPRGTRSLGVVLHLNSDSSVFEFPQQNWEAEHDGQSLEELIVSEPGTVLQDRTISGEGMSFRVYPVPASPSGDTSGVAVASNRQGEELLTVLREVGNKSNFPVVTHALSSPLLLLSRLPRTFGTQDSAFCTLLCYHDFSFCGFFSAEGELILLRSLKHVQGELPQNLESVLGTTAASVEVSEMVVKAFDCRPTRENPLEEELSRLLFQIPFQVFLPPGDQEAVQPIELTVFEVADDNPGLGLSETETFTTTLAEGYHLQDFLSAPEAETSAIPGAVDMKLLRLGRLAGRLGLAASLVFGVFTAKSAIEKTRSREWKSAATKSDKSAKLTAELARLVKTEKLLGGRSRGWEAMELYSRLFPLDGTVRFTSATYSVQTNTGRGRGATKGFSKVWTVEGLAADSNTRGLFKINSQEGMTAVFDEVKEKTGSVAMDLEPKTRNLSVNLDLSKNNRFSRSASEGTPESFAHSFTLDITQRIEDADVLAIPTHKL